MVRLIYPNPGPSELSALLGTQWALCFQHLTLGAPASYGLPVDSYKPPDKVSHWLNCARQLCIDWHLSLVILFSIL